MHGENINIIFTLIIYIIFTQIMYIIFTLLIYIIFTILVFGGWKYQYLVVGQRWFTGQQTNFPRNLCITLPSSGRRYQLLYLIVPKQIWIVNTFFGLIWHQINRKSLFTSQILLDWTWHKILFLCVYSGLNFSLFSNRKNMIVLTIFSLISMNQMKFRLVYDH